MSFDVDATAYDRFMGRYSAPLAKRFVEFARPDPHDSALDVGCGPGALTSELIGLIGPGGVSAVDPSTRFVAAARQRHPEIDVRPASAERLPFASGTFGACLAQLVVNFMPDPVAGIREMLRVTARGGVTAACVWDHGGGRGPLSPFWDAARAADADLADESALPGARRGDLATLFREAGAADVEEGELAVRVVHADFDEWWEPYTLGVGTAGGYLAGLGRQQRARVLEACREHLPDAPIRIEAVAWAARTVVRP